MSNVKSNEMMQRPRRETMQAGDTFEMYDGGYEKVMEVNK